MVGKIHTGKLVSCVVDISPVIYKHTERKLRNAIEFYGLQTMIEVIYDGYLLHRMDYSLDKAATICIRPEQVETYEFVGLFNDLIQCFVVLPNWNNFKVIDAVLNFNLSSDCYKAEMCFDAAT